MATLKNIMDKIGMEKDYEYKGSYSWFTPGLDECKDYYIIVISDKLMDLYTPNGEMVEITTSELKALKNE